MVVVGEVRVTRRAAQSTGQTEEDQEQEVSRLHVGGSFGSRALLTGRHDSILSPSP